MCVVGILISIIEMGILIEIYPQNSKHHYARTPKPISTINFQPSFPLTSHDT